MVERSDSRRSPAPKSLLGRATAWLRPDPLPAITARDAHARRARVTVLDVREPNEWRAGHVPGALHIPLGQLASRLGELDRARPLVVVCRSGNRSAAAVRHLVKAGFQAKNLEGGMMAWARAGLPVKASR